MDESLFACAEMSGVPEYEPELEMCSECIFSEDCKYFAAYTEGYTRALEDIEKNR